MHGYVYMFLSASFFLPQAPYIEKTHAVINFDEGDQVFVISDLNTAHGIYVNESRVQNAAVKLANGDILRIGFSKFIQLITLFLQLCLSKHLLLMTRLWWS